MDFITYIIAAVLGACMGSFLTVVIHRLPEMMRADWQCDVLDFLQDYPLSDATRADIRTQLNTPMPPTLITPRSHCPQCLRTVAWYDNVPIFAYLWLRGRCRYCRRRISPRYVLIELLTAVLSVVAVAQFGIGWQLAAALVFIYAGIALAIIDLRTQLLPDRIVFPVLFVGLLANTQQLFTTPTQSVLGAMAGYGVLWGLNAAYKSIKNIDGMGMGDAKFLAAIGAYFGVFCLPMVLFIAASLGLIAGIYHHYRHQHDDGAPLRFAFGPYLAIGAMIWLFFYETLANAVQIVA